MKSTILFCCWALAAILFFFILVYADKYTEAECLKKGGSYEFGVWSKECKGA